MALTRRATSRLQGVQQPLDVGAVVHGDLQGQLGLAGGAPQDRRRVGDTQQALGVGFDGVGQHVCAADGETASVVLKPERRRSGPRATPGR